MNFFLCRNIFEEIATPPPPLAQNKNNDNSNGPFLSAKAYEPFGLQGFIFLLLVLSIN